MRFSRLGVLRRPVFLDNVRGACAGGTLRWWNQFPYRSLFDWQSQLYALPHFMHYRYS